MNSNNITQALVDKYPDQFKNLKYIECGDGWYEILSRLFYIVNYRLDYRRRINKPLEYFAWAQIKEKFGGLRAYCYGADEFIHGAIEMAESISYVTCEMSGEKGKLRKQRYTEDGSIIPAWMKTLSDSEASKERYVI